MNSEILHPPKLMRSTHKKCAHRTCKRYVTDYSKSVCEDCYIPPTPPALRRQNAVVPTYIHLQGKSNL